MLKGLSSPRASELLKEIGFNEIPEKKVGLFSKILKSFVSPISVMLLFASGLSFLLYKIFDAYFILVLLLINLGITLWQENKADNAIKKLNEYLQEKIKTLRDGKWQLVDSRLLTKGDIIKIASGEVVPADGKILEADNVSINEAALTGESFPKDKNVGDFIYSGSFVAAGIVTVEVTLTGADTKFGKTLFSVEQVRKKSLLERDIINISKFLIILSVIAIIVLTVVYLFKFKGVSFLELLTLDLSLVIAGIPISLPTVMTLIIEFGVLNLAKKNVIVRRLSALEDLANVNFLLTDKTGTLTKNKITVQDIYAYNEFTHNDVLTLAAIVASYESDNSIDSAIIDKTKSLQLELPVVDKTSFLPSDSARKRSTVFVKKDGKNVVITVGAPQIVLAHCQIKKDIESKFDREVEMLAKSGYRTLAVAISYKPVEEKMNLVGIIALSDELRADAKSVVQFLEGNGIGVTMVTGDNRAIASQIAKQLELDDGKVVTKNELDALDWDTVKPEFFNDTGAFAEILPEDKFKLVEKAKKFFVVASNGDGVNDLPALKAANVGIAVRNAVAALKSSADIVLLSEGINVIKDAIIESRKIFERVYVYSLYRISESLRLIVTITVLGILYSVYPLTALQIIVIALLNDIPIISLAFDKVRITNRPAKIDAKRRFVLSSLFGLVGVANSLLLFFVVRNVWHFNWPVIQTMYFLKLTVSGHMLIYVAHTKKTWFKFLPSKEVILATSLTQLIATFLALTGFLMPGKILFWQVIFVWIWALFWMQVSELMKLVQKALFVKNRVSLGSQ